MKRALAAVNIKKVTRGRQADCCWPFSCRFLCERVPVLSPLLRRTWSVVKLHEWILTARRRRTEAVPLGFFIIRRGRRAFFRCLILGIARPWRLWLGLKSSRPVIGSGVRERTSVWFPIGPASDALIALFIDIPSRILDEYNSLAAADVLLSASTRRFFSI